MSGERMSTCDWGMPLVAKLRGDKHDSSSDGTESAVAYLREVAGWCATLPNGMVTRDRETLNVGSC